VPKVALLLRVGQEKKLNTKLRKLALIKITMEATMRFQRALIFFKCILKFFTIFLRFYDPFLRSEFAYGFPCRVKITILTTLILIILSISLL
jgi:hypothetical protein